MNLVHRESNSKGNRAHFQRRREMWTTAILAHPTLSPTAKVVGVAISLHVNGDSWQAWPSHQRLAKMCSISKRTAERGTKELEDVGLLYVSRKANCANRYEMRGGTERDDDTEVSRDMSRDMGVPTQVSLGTDEDVARVPTRMSPEPLIESLIEPLIIARPSASQCEGLDREEEKEERKGSSEEEEISPIPSDSPLCERGPEGPKSEPAPLRFSMDSFRAEMAHRRLAAELECLYRNPVVQTSLIGL